MTAPTPTKDLDYFVGLGYDVVVRKKNDNFCLLIPELTVMAYGKSVSEAYENLVKEKEKYFRNIVEFDLEETVKMPVAMTIRPEHSHEIAQFIKKALIIFVLIVIFFTGLTIPVLSSVQNIINRTAASIPENVVKLESKLANMNDKEKEEVRMKIRNAVTNLKPFTDEFRVLFEDDEKAGKKKAVEK